MSLACTPEVVEKLCAYATRHYPNEFGGLLVGRYEENGRIVHVQDIIIPTRFLSTFTSFFRRNDGVRKKLTAFHAQTPSLVYVGEWHTHPNCPAVPSGTDLRSMGEIVQSPAVIIANPLLLIIKVTGKLCQLRFYVFDKNNLYEFYQID